MRVIQSDMHRMQINTRCCLRFQAFHTGFGRTGKEQVIDQRIRHRGEAGGVAACLPGRRDGQ